jgi:hypothetical protein
MGNGCLEEYPIVHAFAAKACWDDVSGVYADSLAGQDTLLSSGTCIRCNMLYNTKDAFIGPHPNAAVLDIENMYMEGNMGEGLKFISQVNGTAKVFNSKFIGNCGAFSDTTTPIPGAPQVYALSSGLPGAYLSDYCRAGGPMVASNPQAGATWQFAGNTWVSNNNNYHWYLNCATGYNTNNGTCGTATITSTDELYLGYTNSGNIAPQVFGAGDPSITVSYSHSAKFGNSGSSGPPCSGSSCNDPKLVGQPIQQAWTTYNYLNNFNIRPIPVTSPLIGAGIAVTGLTADYFGVTRPNPPTIGAAEPAVVPTVPAPGMFMSVTVPSN